MENELSIAFAIVGRDLSDIPVDAVCESTGTEGGTTLGFRPHAQGSRPKPRNLQQPARGPMLHVSDATQPPPPKAHRRFISRLKVIWVNQHAPNRAINQLHQWGRTKLNNGMNWFKEAIDTPSAASTTEILESFFGEGRSHGK